MNKALDIKAARTKAGMTQEELARDLGVSLATVNRWERGAFKPSRMARLLLQEKFAEIAKRTKRGAK